MPVPGHAGLLLPSTRGDSDRIERDFDCRFRPTSNRVRSRWERLALAQRRGEAIPPIEVYRVGNLDFVTDGHHRVSVAAATGQQAIDTHVAQVLTTVPLVPRSLAGRRQ